MNPLPLLHHHLLLHYAIILIHLFRFHYPEILLALQLLDLFLGQSHLQFKFLFLKSPVWLLLLTLLFHEKILSCIF